MLLPITSTELNILKDFSFLYSQNALLPMYLTESAIVTETRLRMLQILFSDGSDGSPEWQQKLDFTSEEGLGTEACHCVWGGEEP